MLQKLLTISLGISMALCGKIYFYRNDYTYLGQFDAFYKLHSGSINWTDAFFKCEAEGSKLFYPKAPEEWTVVSTLVELKGLSSSDYIYVGIQNEGIEEFITVDGHSTPSPLINDKQLSGGHLCTTMNIGDGSLTIDYCENIDSTLSYVCKKVEDQSCPTIDHEYTYVKENKKCYKVNKRKQSWHEALNTCVMEGGILVNIENQMEANLIMNLINRENNYHAGFRRLPSSDEYFNMKGINMKNTYWNSYGNENLECGAIYWQDDTLYLRTSDCNEKMEFVCEMEL